MSSTKFSSKVLFKSKSSLFTDIKENNGNLFFVRQDGVIFILPKKEKKVNVFLDISEKVLTGTESLSELGLSGLAFHPTKPLFYVWYAERKPRGKPVSAIAVDPCNEESLQQKWKNRDVYFSHVNRLEEYDYSTFEQPVAIRTLLRLRSPTPFHMGNNNVVFDVARQVLILGTGDGQGGTNLEYDPFNLAQSDDELSGKLLTFDVDCIDNVDKSNNKIVTRKSELDKPWRNIIKIVSKGIRNPISLVIKNERFIFGAPGHEVVEAGYSMKCYHQKNFGWRPLEGSILPSLIVKPCSLSLIPREEKEEKEEKESEKTIVAFLGEIASFLSPKRIKIQQPLFQYFNQDLKEIPPSVIRGISISGIDLYLGEETKNLKKNTYIVTDLNGSVFTVKDKIMKQLIPPNILGFITTLFITSNNAILLGVIDAGIAKIIELHV